jgi:hypothetical protein
MDLRKTIFVGAGNDDTSFKKTGAKSSAVRVAGRTEGSMLVKTTNAKLRTTME